jgi:hypothetical protein
MSTLVDFLERLNRKERYFVIAHATGARNLVIGHELQRQLGEVTGVEAPANARLFVDYHLDWLVASLRLAFDQPARLSFRNTGQAVKGNQEDIDLLVAFEERAVTHLAMIEARASARWSMDQLRAKVKRLNSIFGIVGDRFPLAKPHFLLLSPVRPPAQVMKALPKWDRDSARPQWMPLSYPKERLIVEKTLASKKPSRTGSYFTVKSEPQRFEAAA